MKLIPIEEFNDAQWEDIHRVMYDLKLARHMGNDAGIEKPTLQAFYNNLMDGVEAGTFKAWGIFDGTQYKGHTVLVKTDGEWEMGTVLADEEMWSKGYGVKAALHAMRWAFEEDNAPWVVAFTNGRDPKVFDIVEKGGFKKLFHFWVMDRETWDARWRPRMDRFA